MDVALVPEPDGGARVRDLAGSPVASPATSVPPGALPTVVAERERCDPRWVWPATSEIYPTLLRAGVTVARCYDMELVEALLLGYEGRWGEPRSLAAAWARLRGAPVPTDPPARAPTPPGDAQGTLFDTASAPALADGADPVTALVEVHREQARRVAAVADPRRMRLLLAAESAGALVAAEMAHHGLPWRVDVHDAILRDLLGEPSPVGGPPRKLVELNEKINAAFGQRLHPESPAEVLRAFSRHGITLPSTRAWVLRRVEHPAVPLLLEFKELYRIWTAHGWSWCQTWVRDGRFRPEYVPGGVVSGRWATRGGGALQIPKVVRRAVVADPGWTFVVADAGQLEPRILAAVSGDAGMARAAGAGDMYAALAHEAFAGDRARAKVALLGAMYGATGGEAAPALATLRRSYPVAFAYVEQAARTGEGGGLVRSWLGRTSPPASAAVRVPGDDDGSSGDAPDVPDTRPGQAARAWGRFTRNFVIQATAAEWALSLLATLRAALSGTGAHLVFFQHDEVVVHCPAEQAQAVVRAVHDAGDRARVLLFGDTPVRFPLGVSVVECYGDAK
ncbi:MAG TPA: bifunctional 3'-5' exonuclease/DNA polymerase [Micromonosporaceae bacterium]